MNQYTVCFLFDRYDVSKVLMCLKDRTQFAGKFNGIGGKVERFETPLASAWREIEEETGAIPMEELYHLITVKNAQDCSNKPDAAPTCDIHYYAGIVNGEEVCQQEGETEALVWMPTKTLLTHPEFFADFPRIDQLLGEALTWVAKKYLQIAKEGD